MLNIAMHDSSANPELKFLILNLPRVLNGPVCEIHAPQHCSVISERFPEQVSRHSYDGLHALCQCEVKPSNISH